MNGRRHALTGVVAGVITAPFAPTLGVPVWSWVGGAVAGSILPDGDHKQASIARMWGPFSRAIVHVFSPLVGGHRGVTHHPILGTALAVSVLAAASIHPATSAVAWAFLTGVLIAALARIVRPVPWPVNAALSALTGWVAYVHAWPVITLTAPIAVGVLTHLAGDTIPDKSRRARVVEAGSYIVLAAWIAWPYLTNGVPA